MNPIKISIIIAIIGLVQVHTGAAAAAFTIDCQTLNPINYQPQTSFHPGDKVLISVTTNFPDARAAHQKVTLNVQASATIAGIPIPFALNAESTGPNTQPSGMALFQSGTERTVITIPKKAPHASLTLTVQASIQHVGKTTCSSNITIQ